MDPREKTACFTGHRPEKLFQPGAPGAEAQVLEIRRSLHARILRAVDDGYTTFLCGMAQGVDLWAGDMVLSLQESIRQLKLVAVLPYPASVRGWPPEWQTRYLRILKFCTEAVVICPDYRPDCYHQRNRYMVDHASRLIGVWRKGCSGGTQYTVQYAGKKGLDLDLILLP